MRRISLAISTILIILTVVWVAAFSSPAVAKVTGLCGNCHTMHNSQGGVATHEVYESLLVDECVGCHSSSTHSTYYELEGSGRVPVVYYTGGDAPTEHLAGGNFWWVKEGKGGDDTKGHNIFLEERDNFLDRAPGDLGLDELCGNDSCHGNLYRPYTGVEPLTGKYGCEGCHLNVAHHADDKDDPLQYAVVEFESQGWYRFLSGHAPVDGLGVVGGEDPDWQATTSAADHNEYLGTEIDGGAGFSLGKTTTAFCTGCHGRFHSQQRNEDGAWVRHPSDARLCPDGIEGCESGGYTTYDPLSPVARPAGTFGSPMPGVDPETDMVMCLSCHRPHGSPEPDILRWPYEEMIAGDAESEWQDKGCFACHRNKDTGS